MMSKSYRIFVDFIDRVISGEKAMIFNRDYVVLSRNMWDSLAEKKGMSWVEYDEMKEITEEEWKILVGRVKIV